MRDAIEDHHEHNSQMYRSMGEAERRIVFAIFVLVLSGVGFMTAEGLLLRADGTPVHPAGAGGTENPADGAGKAVDAGTDSGTDSGTGGSRSGQGTTAEPPTEALREGGEQGNPAAAKDSADEESAPALGGEGPTEPSLRQPAPEGPVGPVGDEVEKD